LSVRARLTLVFAAAMTVVLLGAAAFVYAKVRDDLRSSVDMGLRSRAQVIVANAARPAARIGGGAGRHHLIDADEAFAQVLTTGGSVAESTPAVRRAPLVPATTLATVRSARFVDATPPGLDPARLLVVPIAAGPTRGYAVVGATLSNSREALGTLVRQLEIALPAALVMSTIVAWLVAGAALRPVERMRREAAEITVTDPTRRLPVPRTNDTLARLARTLNATLDRLQTARERERRFVDEASHELRTPLTILRAEIDSALAQRSSRERLEQALVSAREETEHLIRIAEGLLVLARAHDGQIPIAPEDVRLQAVVDGSVAAQQAVASQHDVRVEAHVADAGVRLDPTRARQALDNLIDNAIRHSPHGGTVRVYAAAEDGRATFAVEDDGPGFDAGLLDGPFVAFHRGHGAVYPGSGLGLSIVAAVADAHHGTMDAKNRADGGARVTLVLAAGPAPRTGPAAPAAQPRGLPSTM